MSSSAGLGLDNLLHSLLRHLVEEAEAEGGLVVTAAGAVLARHPQHGRSVPPIPEPELIGRVLTGDSWAEGRRFYAPLMIGARPVAALMIEHFDGERIDPDLARRLLAHAAHVGLAWSPLPAERSPETDPLPPLHVLVVEDNEVNRKVAKAFLEHAGHAVAICPDGAQAVEAVREGDFDVVLMDIRMPGMDGVEATRAIRALPDRRRAGLPILALTANFTSNEVEGYLAAGMNDIIRKPLRMGDIEKALAPFFGLPDEELTSAAPDQAGTSPVLDQERVELLAEALAPARLTELFVSAQASIVETLADLRRHWAEEDIVAAGKSAHRLAGVAANFGCSALGKLARAIEMDCKQGSSGQEHAPALADLETLTLEALNRLTAH